MKTTPITRRRFTSFSASLCGTSWLTANTRAQEKSTRPDASQLQSVIGKGIDFLRTKGQADDGSFSKQVGIGVTALACTALLRLGRSPEDPTVARGLKFITDHAEPTGGIHLPNGRLKTYETCVAVVCLKEANRDGRYDAILK